MKAIILAAGLGTRLGKYTENLPKCMLEFQGATLIARQVATLRSAEVRDIVVVRGYKPETICLPDVIYCENTNYETTNMVSSLMAAEKYFPGDKEDLLVCYSDVIYPFAV